MTQDPITLSRFGIKFSWSENSIINIGMQEINIQSWKEQPIDLKMFNEKEVGVGDFVLLPQINMENFLENLKVRHSASHIYTYIGKTEKCQYEFGFNWKYIYKIHYNVISSKTFVFFYHGTTVPFNQPSCNRRSLCQCKSLQNYGPIWSRICWSL